MGEPSELGVDLFTMSELQGVASVTAARHGMFTYQTCFSESLWFLILSVFVVNILPPHVSRDITTSSTGLLQGKPFIYFFSKDPLH